MKWEHILQNVEQLVEIINNFLYVCVKGCAVAALTFCKRKPQSVPESAICEQSLQIVRKSIFIRLQLIIFVILWRLKIKIQNNW